MLSPRAPTWSPRPAARRSTRSPCRGALDGGHRPRDAAAHRVRREVRGARRPGRGGRGDEVTGPSVAPRAGRAGRARARARQPTEEVPPGRGALRLARPARHPITVIGPDGTITYQSPSIERLLGYDDRMAGRRFDELPSLDGDRCATCSPTWPRSRATSRRSSSARWYIGTARRQFEVNCTNLLATSTSAASSSTAATSAAQGLRGAADPPDDPVTGLANRALFAERVRRDRPHAPRAPERGRDLPRPRRLQDDQRQPGARGRRRGARRGGEAPGDERPRDRHRGALRRRRVRACSRTSTASRGGRHGGPRAAR